jgi:hypothetical protein
LEVQTQLILIKELELLKEEKVNILLSELNDITLNSLQNN